MVMGMKKHARSGHPVNSSHFTGKKAGKQKRRKGRRGLTKRQRKERMNSHINQYSRP
jgi:hypothetical protein